MRIALGLAITLFFVAHAAEWVPTADGKLRFVAQLDNIIYDARLVMTMPRASERRIVILDIDEKSLGELGRWPWSRRLMAELVDKLFERHGVAVLGFDVVWAERDSSSGMDVLDGLARGELKGSSGFQAAYSRLRKDLDFDARFAASLKGRPVVLGYYFNSDERAAKANALPAPVLPRDTFAGRRVFFPSWSGYTGNLPVYLESAALAGHINPLADFDGVLRRVPLVVEYEGAYYEAFSLAMVRAWLAGQGGTLPTVEAGFPPDSPDLEWLKVGGLQIPVDERAAALVPYRARGAFSYVSLADVVADRVAPEALKGKVAIIGTTAPGLQDMRATPVAGVYPGVEVHANLIAGIVDGDVKQRPLYVIGAEVVLLLAFGVAFALLIPRLSALWATVAAAAGLALLAAGNVAVWQAGLVLPLAALALTIAAIYILNMAYGYFVESRSKRQLAGRFGEYVPPELVDRMASDPGRYDMEPKSAELTILFADVRGFTGISESLRPEDLREYINEYLTEMSMIIRSRHRGTLDKYIGDAIMAFWGAPVADAQHARNALLAALEMQKQCAPLNRRLAARGWPMLRIGIGVNSGTVRVGDMGSRLRRAYTAMGDAVNVASRLEGRTKTYGVGILAGEATRALVKDMVFREIDRIRVKGKDEAITVYEPLGLEPEAAAMRDELRLWNQALRAYRAQHWDDTDVTLLNLQRQHPGRELYRFYAQKVAQKRRAPPPPDWDGVTVFDEK
ncbi:MAG: CHASE2 domain-containing protein [Burkholderiales bacterium]